MAEMGYWNQTVSLLFGSSANHFVGDTDNISEICQLKRKCMLWVPDQL